MWNKITSNKVSVGYTFLVAMHLHVAISCLKFWLFENIFIREGQIGEIHNNCYFCVLLMMLHDVVPVLLLTKNLYQ